MAGNEVTVRKSVLCFKVLQRVGHGVFLTEIGASRDQISCLPLLLLLAR
jgi:hypothetical protein